VGTSCEAGASTTRTQDGQPSPKQNLRRFAAAFRAESTPGHANPVVPAPIRTPEKPQKRQASFTQQSPETKASGAKRGGSQEPTPRLTRSLNAESRKVDPSHPPLTRTPHVPATAQQKTDTLGSLAPLDACPPCSRKGPFLATCGLKRPRRVKRETTNSRFCGPLGTWGGRWSDSKPNRPQGGGWRVGGVGSRSGLEPNPRGGGGRIQNWSGPVLNRTGRNLLFLLLLFRHHRFQTGFRINPRVLVPNPRNWEPVWVLIRNGTGRIRNPKLAGQFPRFAGGLGFRFQIRPAGAQTGWSHRGGWHRHKTRCVSDRFRAPNLRP